MQATKEFYTQERALLPGFLLCVREFWQEPLGVKVNYSRVKNTHIKMGTSTLMEEKRKKTCETDIGCQLILYTMYLFSVVCLFVCFFFHLFK